MYKIKKKLVVPLVLILCMCFANLMPSYATMTSSDEFVSYTEQDTGYNMYYFKVSSVSFRNQTGSPVTLRYIQTETVTTNWVVTGSLTVSAEFKVAWLAKASATLGITVSDSKTNSSSTAVEFSISVPNNKTGYIEKYLGGQYSGGRLFYLRPLPPGYSGPPTPIYEYNQGGWGVVPSDVNYKAYCV